jgi:hypothetical protein
MHDTGHVPNLSEVADRLAIHDVLATHSRGIDRADTEILKTAYWPDAIVYYGAFEGSAHTFCERGRYLDRMQRRSGVWKIIERRVVMDWNRLRAANAHWDGALAKTLLRGTRDRNDPAYAHLASRDRRA